MIRNSLHLAACVLLAVAHVAAPSAHADLSLVGQSTTASFNMPVSSREQIWIQKSLIRRDYSDRGRAYTQLFDLSTRQAVVIDHFTRMAEIYALGALEKSTSATAPSVSLKMSFEPTGNTRKLQTWSCREHDLQASLPARLGNEETVFHLSGKIWIASGAAEQREVKTLSTLARQPEFFIATPALAQMAPAQTRAMSELIRKLAGKGLPCAGEIEGSYDGNGPMVNLARKLPSRAAIGFESWSTEPLKPDHFDIPAGYQRIQRQMPARLPGAS